MVHRLAKELLEVIEAMQHNLLLSLQLLLLLWGIHIANYMADYRFNKFGIKTRFMTGIPGIFLAPLLHGDFNHLFFNSIPFFVLSSLLLIDGKVAYYKISLLIIIISGFFTWLLGRRGVHIGASGLIMGYFGYLLARAYFGFSGTTIILAGICIYYFGGLIGSIFPGAKCNVSWDGHLFGMLAGVLVASGFRGIGLSF